MTDGDNTWQLALAKLEGKIDALITSVATLSASLHDIDKRVRQLETEQAAIAQRLAESDRAKPAPTQWTSVVASAAAIATLLILLADRVYGP